MKKNIRNILSITLAVPQLVFGSQVFQPHFQNYGHYLTNKSSETRYSLYGHVPPDVNHSTKKQALNKDKILTLSIVLSLNNEQELDERLSSITNPLRPDYQHYMTQAEFINNYSPTAEQVELTKKYLEHKGMHIESTAPNRLIIRASGSVAVIEKAFNTKIYYYTDKTGKTFYAPQYELQTDKKLPILSILGLENKIKPEPLYRRLNNPQPSAGLGVIQGMTPENIKTAYSVPSNLTGAGQTLALYQLDGYTTSDITTYEDAFNIPHVTLQNILLDGATGIPSSGPYPAEVTLDIEMMIALAPGVSKILVYEGAFTAAGMVNTFNRIATDNLAKSISTSYGINESSNAASIFRSENAIFKQMVAQGQTLFAATGDYGAYSDHKTLGIMDPASQPFVVAVGGTKLLTNPNGSYLSETTWRNGTGPGDTGSTGGISTFWDIPSWQQGVISTDSKGSTTMRNVPDVSLNSDPQTGYAVYYNGSWSVVGGTSAAAPLWAAFTALVNQNRANNGLEPLGFPNPTFYTLGQSANYQKTFHDIKDFSTNLYYPAVPGYDLATGWGSFIGNALIDYLSDVTPPVTCIQANPTVSITPATQTSTPGGVLTYTVNVSNNDNAICSASTFALTSNLPTGFTGALAKKSLNLSPGTSGSSSITVTSALSSTAENYTFSVNAENSGATNYKGTGSAIYAINGTQAQLNLSVDPKSATYSYNSGQTANFKFSLMNGQNPVPNKPINLKIQTPFSSWNANVTTWFDGTAVYSIQLNSVMTVGNYQVTATTYYQGNTATTQSNFVIK